MRIAILCVVLGRYDIFWPQFISSCRRYFCVDAHRHWYVFTDSPAILPAPSLTILHQDFLGWPFNSLYRYHMFSRVRRELENFDHVVFFNANAFFTSLITPDDFFGGRPDVQLVAGRHPGLYKPSGFVFPFEKRPSSSAYVEHGCDYFQGCINAGTGSAFSFMIHELSSAIDRDLHRGIVACWHDESHWNRYVLDLQKRNPRSVHVLDSNFLSPADLPWSLPMPPRILMLNKQSYGGHSLLRQYSHQPTRSLLQKIKERFLSRVPVRYSQH